MRWACIAVLIGGCCFTPPPSGGRSSPTTTTAPPAPVTANQRREEAVVAAQASAAVLPPEQRLALAEATASNAAAPSSERDLARAHLGSLPEDFETRRSRAALRLLDRTDRAAHEVSLREARQSLRELNFAATRTALQQIPDGSPSARQRDRVQADLTRAELREVRLAATRGPVPGVSAWSGSATAVTRYLNSVANDPGSIEIERCGDVMILGDEYYQDCIYRGRNAFGGLVANATRFFIQHDEVVRTRRL